MVVEDINLASGTWLVANCAEMPSESNCQLVIMAPEDQREDLIDAGVKHAVSKHDHHEDAELERGVASMIHAIEVE